MANYRNQPTLVSSKTVLDLAKMVTAALMFSFLTTYWLTPVQGARHVLQLAVMDLDLEVATVADDAVFGVMSDNEVEQPNKSSSSDHGDDESGEKGDQEAAFDTFWPIIMMLITGMIFVIIVIIVCKRFCSNNGRPEWGPRNRSMSLEGVRNTQTTTAEREARDQPPAMDGGDVWSVNINMDILGGVSLPERSAHLKPPPYCDKPPSYDDITPLGLGLPKYDTENFDVSLGGAADSDGSVSELGESTSELNLSRASGSSSLSSRNTSTSTIASPSAYNILSTRRYHRNSTSTCPNEPPPVYEEGIRADNINNTDNNDSNNSPISTRSSTSATTAVSSHDSVPINTTTAEQAEVLSVENPAFTSDSDPENEVL